MGVTDHVLEHLPVADQLALPVVDQHFRRTETPVVLIAHPESIRSRVLHHDQIPFGNVRRKFTLLDPEVGILAELPAESELFPRTILFPVYRTSVFIPMSVPLIFRYDSLIEWTRPISHPAFPTK